MLVPHGPTLTKLKRIFATKKGAAKRKGIPFSLSFEDIEWPTYCPLLGIKLNYGEKKVRGPTPNSQSFDRRDPTKGYIPGNVRIISNKANVMKSSATPSELMQLACNLKHLEEYK